MPMSSAQPERGEARGTIRTAVGDVSFDQRRRMLGWGMDI